jgi:ankyrin repeat protein
MGYSNRCQSEPRAGIDMSATQYTICGWAAWLIIVTVASGATNAPLAEAAENNNTDAVRALVKKKSDVNARQADGMTALHWAAHHDDLSMVKLLLKSGADAKAANRYGVTPLTLACTNGNAAIVEELLKAGADVDGLRPGGETALMTASRTGRLGPVEKLLERGADVNAREANGQTALMWAAAEGHVEVVDALLKSGADFRTALASGFTPFFFAIREGRTDVALRLIEAGIDVNEPMRPKNKEPSASEAGITPLILAVENGHFELSAALLKAGADPDQQHAGFAAIHAITWVRKPIRGDGNPPPIGSGKVSSLDFVRQLVEHGAEVNARLAKGGPEFGKFTTTGATAFFLAARASDISLMRLLIELGADPGIANADNCSPLSAATGVGALGDGEESAGTEDEALETVRALLDLGADMNAVDDNGETAMHGAAYQSRAKIVNLLAERGADINVWHRKNKSGWTPLMIAQGHRPGNFRPAPDTIAAIEAAMRDKGVAPPKATRDDGHRGY